MKLNTQTNQYVLELDDVIQNTDYTSEDLEAHQIDLRTISRDTYRVLYSFYKGANAELNRKKFDDYVIEYNKSFGLMFVMIEYLKGAIISGLDLNSYVNEFFPAMNGNMNQKRHFSNTVKEEARSQGLYFPGGIIW